METKSSTIINISCHSFRRIKFQRYNSRRKEICQLFSPGLNNLFLRHTVRREKFTDQFTGDFQVQVQYNPKLYLLNSLVSTLNLPSINFPGFEVFSSYFTILSHLSMEMQSSVIQDGFHVKIKSKKNTNSVVDNLETQVGFNRPNKN